MLCLLFDDVDGCAHPFVIHGQKADDRKQQQDVRVKLQGLVKTAVDPADVMLPCYDPCTADEPSAA